MTNWVAKETTTHQDHVIAHVLGATALGYFVLDETAYLLLDIGFIWRIYLDGEMGLLPHPVAVAELETDDRVKNELRADIDLLLQDGRNPDRLKRITVDPGECLIQSVDFYQCDNSRRLVLTGDDGSIVIETSMDSGEFRIMTEDKDSATDHNEEGELYAVAQAEREFVCQRLRDELGREPKEEEIDRWLREQTEGY